MALRRIVRPTSSAPATEPDDAPPIPDERDEDEVAPVRSGWAGARKVAQSDKFPERVKLTEDAHLYKFLDEEPAATYREHWLDGVTSTRRKGFTCIEVDCPLCGIGDTPRARIMFNVVDMDEIPTIKTLTIGNRDAKSLEAIASDARTGPLTKGYFNITSSGKAASYKINFGQIKERDLEEDWDTQPLTDEQIAAFVKKRFTAETVKRDTRAYLAELAEEVSE